MPSDVKVEAVASYPRPKMKTDVRNFLGLTSYYQHYIKNYSKLASPLTDTLRKKEATTLIWVQKSRNHSKI